MREILFRGKRIDNGEWVYGDLINNHDGRKFVGKVVVDDYKGTANDTYEVGIGFVEVDPSTVGQYTGLTDKNGKKIFEGDIYTWRDCGDYHACLICFGNYFDGYADRYATMARGFYVKPLDGGTFNFAGAGYSEIEISGNIHDNPELLEVG